VTDFPPMLKNPNGLLSALVESVFRTLFEHPSRSPLARAKSGLKISRTGFQLRFVARSEKLTHQF
jgi:hypothetical protein